jgi:RNA polymerase sigma-70 factor, ECF subfamily
LTRDRDIAAEAAQDALELAFRSLAKFEGRSAFAVWLHRIAVNSSFDQIRRVRRRMTRTEDTNGGRRPRVGAGAGDEPGEEILGDADHVLSAVRSLDDDLRSVVVLRYWFDYTHQQTADILGIPVGTVYTRASRALAQLKALLEESHALRS